VHVLVLVLPRLQDPCTGLAAEAAVFTAVGDVLGEPVTMFYAQNGYGSTGQLIADLLARGGVIRPSCLDLLASMSPDDAARAQPTMEAVTPRA
jgi:hypothetical protein